MTWTEVMAGVDMGRFLEQLRESARINKLYRDAGFPDTRSPILIEAERIAGPAEPTAR